MRGGLDRLAAAQAAQTASLKAQGAAAAEQDRLTAALIAVRKREKRLAGKSVPSVEVPAPRPDLVVGDKPEKYELPVVIRFAVQVITGTLAFGLVAGAALLLSQFVDFIETRHVSPYVVTGLRGVELLIFGADMLVMTIFVVVEALDLSRSLLVKAWKTMFRRSTG
ncbi:hypothetical protein HN018_22770 (plasmid) [Lichenicola cladoniae]|uniref:Uncharacterized protein n=1 Tax=Lichenicola cladoniae TaxID=1484109 RepID=A0A6M8HXV8_9PROT|nr:hypothetical protein [Lichenicola cladoniae]NPD69326.1 hypothetical protein [Acetobacteraceae bacterium]QKE93027.1 hypothetical protein HN018_22770 [Lichenicola cladoniae]